MPRTKQVLQKYLQILKDCRSTLQLYEGVASKSKLHQNFILASFQTMIFHVSIFCDVQEFVIKHFHNFKLEYLSVALLNIVENVCSAFTLATVQSKFSDE